MISVSFAQRMYPSIAIVARKRSIRNCLPILSAFRSFPSSMSLHSPPLLPENEKYRRNIVDTMTDRISSRLNNVGKGKCDKGVLAPALQPLQQQRYFSNSSSSCFSKESLPKEEVMADHAWRQLNHIWSKEELEKQRETSNYKHVPKTITDHIAHKFMKFLYVSFNTISGYREENPTTKSIEWRLIILESVAGVPGFLAAGFRHFYSLRNLKRDHGAIYTFLEEAENERMHLLVCMKMFEANFITKTLVVLAQVTFTPFLWLVYTIKPQLVHRFVGYLEETAVHTYSNILYHVETEGTHLNKEWKNLPAPEIAKAYWNLDKDGKWVDCLAHMLADEAHHRDVNHTFADLPRNAPNPFVQEHMEDFDKAVRRRYADMFEAAKEEGTRQKTSDPLIK